METKWEYLNAFQTNVFTTRKAISIQGIYLRFKLHCKILAGSSRFLLYINELDMITRHKWINVTSIAINNGLEISNNPATLPLSCLYPLTVCLLPPTPLTLTLPPPPCLIFFYPLSLYLRSLTLSLSCFPLTPTTLTLLSLGLSLPLLPSTLYSSPYPCLTLLLVFRLSTYLPSLFSSYPASWTHAAFTLARVTASTQDPHLSIAWNHTKHLIPPRTTPLYPRAIPLY